MLVHEAAYRNAIAQCVDRYGVMLTTDDKDISDFLSELRAKNIEGHPLNKLNRWLGYIQGVLIERGATTVQAERDWTRPLFRPLDYPKENVVG